MHSKVRTEQNKLHELFVLVLYSYNHTKRKSYSMMNEPWFLPTWLDMAFV